MIERGRERKRGREIEREIREKGREGVEMGVGMRRRNRDTEGEQERGVAETESH